MRASRLLAVSGLALTIFACSAQPTGPTPEPAKASSSAIINGQNDTTHQAVVAIIAQDPSNPNQVEECSGTIVKVDATRHIGWVLTAAHCVNFPPSIVFQGDDFQAPTAIHYDVIDYLADSRYSQGGNAGQPHDFAVIRIAGVDATTPTIPYTGSPDGVTAGTPVIMVGYGRTTLNSSGDPGDNSVRHSVSQTVGQVQTQELVYNQSAKGVCQGDSGGPDLVGTGTNLKVVGVHSFIEGDCDGNSDSGRVAESTNLAFINAQINAALPADTCELCTKVSNSGNQECSQLNTACFADKDCKGYYDCATNCNGGSACIQACLKKFPKAEGPLNAAAGCACNRTCNTQCVGSLSCRGIPKCGYTFPKGECTTCTEGTCCQESLDCGSDGVCYLCLKNGDDSDPSCATNAARKKLANCVSNNCKDACAGTGLDNGADPPGDEDPGDQDGGAGGGGTTTTTNCGCKVVGEDHGRSGASGLALAIAAIGLAFARRKKN